MKAIYTITLFSTLVLAGCAHEQPKPPKTQESFITQIKPDGTKQFSYSLTTEMSERKDVHSYGGSNGGGGHGSHGGHHDGARSDHKGRHSDDKDDEMQEKFTLIFDDALNLKLNSTGFCRNGFIQLDKQSRHGAMLVKGECNENAIDADREKFPNPPPKKVKVDVVE